MRLVIILSFAEVELLYTLSLSLALPVIIQPPCHQGIGLPRITKPQKSFPCSKTETGSGFQGDDTNVHKLKSVCMSDSR